MKHKTRLLPSVITMTLSLAFGVASAAPLQVVSSFSILADLVQQVGGEHVASVAIVGPESDAHSFEPRPSDAKTLQNADLLLINGADFEAWLPKLVQASGYKGEVIEAIHGVPLRAYHDDHDDQHHDDHDHGDHDHDHDHGSHDPHAWQNLEYAQGYVKNIRDALIAKDPAHTAYYEQRALDYSQRLQTLHIELKQAFDELPATHRTAISSHDAFGYLGQAYGVEFLSLLGVSNQAEPSAKELANLISYMRDNQVKAIFIENISSPKLMEQIARETNATLGDPLYSDALAKSPHPADSYLGMMQWNAQALLKALKP